MAQPTILSSDIDFYKGCLETMEGRLRRCYPSEEWYFISLCKKHHKIIEALENLQRDLQNVPAHITIELEK